MTKNNSNILYFLGEIRENYYIFKSILPLFSLSYTLNSQYRKNYHFFINLTFPLSKLEYKETFSHFVGQTFSYSTLTFVSLSL